MKSKVQLPKQAIERVVYAINQKLSENKPPLLIAIDGRSGVGKTTLSKEVGELLGAAVVLEDDFYAGGSLKEWSSRTAKEKADKCMDWRRLRKEALELLLAGKAAKWRTFNWQTLEGLSENFVFTEPSDVIILDGAYSSRPELADIIDLSILLQMPDEIRRARLRSREGEEFMAAWHQVWDEAEDYYFKSVRPPQKFDLVVDL